MNAKWHYVILSEADFYRNWDNGANLEEIFKIAQIHTEADSKGTLF